MASRTRATDPWVAVNQGYEIQIDQYGRMDGAPKHYTGAIYDIQGPNRDTRLAPREGWVDWNTYEITVEDPKITVVLNGEVVNEFISTDPARDLSTGHFGLQNHSDIDTWPTSATSRSRISPRRSCATRRPPRAADPPRVKVGSREQGDRHGDRRGGRGAGGRGASCATATSCSAPGRSPAAR